MLKNFNPSASSRKPSTTFTELSHPPDLGRLVSHDGKSANRVKGKAKAKEKPSIPMMGMMTFPPAEATSMAPTMGPVQEKETSTKVKAMKKAPANPPLSACLSALLIIQFGRVISNIPKKEKAKKRKIRKKKTFGIQWVLRKLAKMAPRVTATTVPMTV